LTSGTWFEMVEKIKEKESYNMYMGSRIVEQGSNAA
jgi:hypothetical protein